jgi:AcrR family transcriptional regulator
MLGRIELDTVVCQYGPVSAVTRPHRGVSADQRRAERRARLVGACLDLLGEGGVAAVSAESVATRAGLTKRYFYESFTDRDALLDELLAEFFTDVRTAMLAATSGPPATARERAHAIAETLIDFLRRDPRRARLYAEAPGHPGLQARREQAYEVFTQLIIENFASGADDPSDEETGQRRTLAALLLVAGTTQAVITWLQGRIQLSRDSVVDELARVIIATLDR